MAELKPFGALRFTPQAGSLGELVCPPYDIIGEEERKGYLARNPRNIIRLELPKEGEDPYKEAGNTLGQWLEDRMLACDEAPGYYIYEEEFTALGERRTVKGLVTLVRLEEFEKGVILPHEETLSKAKADRFNLMCATGCNFSSIYSLYFDREEAVYPRLERLSAGSPAAEFSTGDGIVHRVWKVEEPAELREVTEAFAGKTLYIADGHHRYETALRYRDHLRAQGIVRDDAHAANYVMMTLVHMEHPGLVVYPTHRIVRGLERFDGEKLLEECAAYFDREQCAPQDVEAEIARHGSTGKKAAALYHGGKTTLLVPKERAVAESMLPGKSEAYRRLGVSVLHTLILERILGIDRENMANQKNLTYTRDIAEAVRAVDAGEADCAFLIGPTGVEEIAVVAEAGEKMPQKSTYFYPKLITGHLMNKIL